MGKPCVICGKPGFMYYPFCKKHLDMKAEGKIIKCPHCEEWHLANKPCQCESEEYYTELPTEGFDHCVACGARTSGYAFCHKCFGKYTEEQMLDMLNDSEFGDDDDNKRKGKGKGKAEAEAEAEVPVKFEKEKANRGQEENDDHVTDGGMNKVVSIDPANRSRCITCGRQTDGLLFCSACYYKYKNKELLFKITNCSSVELLDEDYEGKYTCKDGHIVKSKSERDIDNYLFEHEIQHAYEHEIAYGREKNQVLHPDFLLPNYLGVGHDVYIEHWGYDENNRQYTKTKKFKMPIYRQLGITLICLYEKTDMGKVETALDRKLNKTYIQENKINYVETQTEEADSAPARPSTPIFKKIRDDDFFPF